MVSTDVIVGIVMNVLSTVGIVVANKYLYRRTKFEFMLTLSCIHFIFTSLAQRVFLRMGLFQYKATDAYAIMPLVLGSAGSVGFMNLNLAYNSVGFYQLSKLLCIPATLLLQYLMQGKSVSRQIQYSLVVILVGVGIATISDIELNLVGTVYATLAVISTTLAQIYTNAKQSELGLDHMQLLYHTAPYIAIVMAMMIPLFDPVIGPHGLLEFTFTLEAVFLIFLTCIMAVLVNITNYLVIGKTSPVTYQVVGHMKTVLILVFGFAVFQYPIDPNNLLGIALAVFGMIIYTELKRRESSPAAPAAKIPSKVNGTGTVQSPGRALETDSLIGDRRT